MYVYFINEWRSVSILARLGLDSLINVCLYVCVVCVCIYMYAEHFWLMSLTYVCCRVSETIYTGQHTSTYIQVHTCAQIQYICVYMHLLCMYVCMYVCMYICIELTNQLSLKSGPNMSSTSLYSLASIGATTSCLLLSKRTIDILTYVCICMYVYVCVCIYIYMKVYS